MATSNMVRFFTQLCPMSAVRSGSNLILSRQCLFIRKGKLTPLQSYRPFDQCRTYVEGAGEKGSGTGGPKKEEQIESIKMPGFVHPHTTNEEGYFTQKAHQQLEELKKKLEKPTIDNTEKKE